MEPKEVRTALKFYQAGYDKALVTMLVIGIVAVTALSLLVVTDPLKLYGVGTWTETHGGTLYDCESYSWDDTAKGCTEKWVTLSTKAHGHPTIFMVAIYGFFVAFAFVILSSIILNPRRATRSVAADLAIEKTLGLGEEEKKE